MYLFGASGHAKVIIDILKALDVKIEALVDDNLEINRLLDYPVLHNRTDISPVIVSIGDNRVRKKISEKIKGEFYKAVHPSAIISNTVSIGEGSVVMQGAIVQSDVEIGKHCIINTAASIDHDCIIEDFVHISPHSTLCGNIYIGEGTWIGAGAVIIPGVKIGKWSVIGAGSVVINDIPDNVLAVGNICKIIKQLR